MCGDLLRPDVVPRRRRGIRLVDTTAIGRPARGQIHLLLVGLAVLTGFLVERHFRWDDAFITFRMARNIAHGHGWTYNPGSSQDAATGALWTLLLAGLAWAHVGIVGAANVLCVVFLGGAAILVFETLDLLGATRAGVLAGILVASSEFLALSTGMELPMAIFLLSLSTYLAQRGSLLWAGIAAGMGVLTRGDMGLFAGVLAAALLVRWGIRVWRFIAGIAAVLVPWSVIAALFIGHVLPDTLTAKMDQGRSGFWSGAGTYIGYMKLMPTGGPTGGGHAEVWFIVVGTLGLLGLATVATRRHLRPLLVLLVFGVLYVIAYGYVLRVPGYPWYYTMPVFALTVLAGVGLDLIFGLLPVRSASRPALALLGALALSAISLAGAPRAFPRLASYATAARWLDQHAPQDRSVAAAEVGIIGWDCPKRTVIDYLGLTSRSAAQKVREGDMLWWVSHDRPDYWMTLKTNSFPVDQQLLNAPWLDTTFKPVWSDQLVVLYERVGPIPPEK